MSALIRVPTRIFWILSALLLLILTCVSFRALLSDVYESVAQQRYQSHPDSVVAQSAAQLATQFASWKSDAWEILATTLSQAQKPTAAVAAMTEAVRWAPVDGEKWAGLAQLSGQAHGLNGAYPLFLQRTAALAPRVSPVQQRVAFQGVYWWAAGNSAVKQLWLESMRASLRMDTPYFLASVVWLHREENFCHNVGAALKLKQWCDWTAFARSACLSGKPLYPEQQKYCETYRYAEKPKEPVD